MTGVLVANQNDLDNYEKLKEVFNVLKLTNHDGIQWWNCSENLAAIPHDKICRTNRALGFFNPQTNLISDMPFFVSMI